jgi:hypothetical protein
MTFLVTVQNKFGALPTHLRELTMHPSLVVVVGGGGMNGEASREVA